VFAAVHRGSDVYSGPAMDLAPDLMLDSWSAGYRVAPGRERTGEIVGAPASLAGVNEAWSSDHRPVGIFVAAGARAGAGEGGELSLCDVCPTVLALLEQPVPAGLDGTVAESALAPGFLRAHPVRAAGEAAGRAGSGGYSEDEAAAVATHLRDLGYID
jgi:predicted AlkP superfamily phosphohydrolase/phosphomutase